MSEGDRTEYKSLTLVTRASPAWDDVARECVCFANGRGGTLILGVEDGETEPAAGQRVPPHLPETLFKRLSERTFNLTPTFPEIRVTLNGGEVLEVAIPPSHSVACTRKGTYYARISDECQPVMPEDLLRLVAEKGAVVWELMPSQVPASSADPALVDRLLTGLRSSDRVKEGVRSKTDAELLSHYNLSTGGRLTHLGVLWVGRREHRARLLHSPIIQYIRYGDLDRKVDKEIFGDDYTMSPWDQLEAITSLVVWNESVEVSRGLFRDRVPHYDIEIVRELVANALVHRAYTIRGDIFVSLYRNRLEVHSPGSLPYGITPRNILHERKRRNESLARLFHDLKLMEGEGSGYDRVYSILLSSGKPVPEVREASDRVEVTVRGHDLDKRALLVVSEADRMGPLPERERITLGLLARSGPVSKIQLAESLSLSTSRDADDWLGTLIERSLVVRTGRALGTRYGVNPALLKRAGAKTKTSLVDIQPHRLLELVRTDLKHFPASQIRDILERIGPEISRRRVQRALQALRDDGTVVMQGERGRARYSLAAEA